MINGLSVLGWGVGGIEAEAAMLGQPISMVVPEVIGFEIKGKIKEGITATDLVLTITEQLRKKGVVGKFVEFYGDGLINLTLADRATIANMAPEYGATCGFLPVDDETLKYLKLSGRDQETIALVEKYSKEQGLWASDDVVFTDTLSLDVSSVVTSISGPKRPQDKVLLTEASTAFANVYKENAKRDKAIIVEGYIDVISLHAKGINNSVASLGTALNKYQISQLCRCTDNKNIILNFDSDNAGILATKRVIKEVESLSLNDQINLKILQLNNFKAPDEFLNNHTPEDYFNLIDNSSFWIDWEIDQIFKDKI